MSALLGVLPVTEEEVNLFRDKNVGLCGVDTTRISRYLLSQLAAVQKHRVFSSFAVTDVIQSLEGCGRPGRHTRQEKFKHPPLMGLWKAHFVDASFLMRNLINEWGLEFEHSKKFEDLRARVALDEESNPSPLGWQGRLAHELVMSGYQSRAARGKLTGEWLVFGRHDDENYYLGIAQHSTTRSDDEELFAILEYFCRTEYPFLFGNPAA